MHSISHSPRNIAFSLVELSIVLVILGLLIGGILAGKSLIRASELRSVSTEVDRYMVAFHSFRDKYFYLPGDAANATQFWNSAGGNGANAACYAAQTLDSTATCNGNGDGMITSRSTESVAAWKHLANAGLIEGNYSGVFTASWILGENTPVSKISRASYTPTFSAISGPFSEYWDQAHNGNGLFFGRASDIMRLGIFNPEEQWNIDTKMDDGNPSTGRVISVGDASGCTNGSYPTASYRLSNSAAVCAPRFAIR